MLRQRVKLLRGDHQHTIDPDFAKAFRDKVHLSEITPGEPDLEFLYELTGALDEWLEEIRSSADGRLSFPASYGSGRLGMDRGRYDASHTIDGKMFSSKMIQQIRSYEKVWMERYNRGENPYAVPVPTPTKELLAQIIRLCPITEKDSSKRNGPIQRHSVYSSDWLVKKLGYRFMTEKSRSNHQAIRLQNFDLTREISQADLSCSDQAWEGIRPTIQRIAAPKIPLCPVPELMRARCAVTARGPNEDVWMALMALPPQFLVPLLGYKDKYLDTDWRLRLMVTSPSLEQIEMLEKGWSLASQLLSCSKPKRYNRDVECPVTTTHSLSIAVQGPP
jgi:hypothetical protein